MEPEQKTLGHADDLVVVGLALGRGLDRMNSSGPFQPSFSTTLYAVTRASSCSQAWVVEGLFLSGLMQKEFVSLPSLGARISSV